VTPATRSWPRYSHPDNEGDVKASKAPFIRLVELDPATGKVRNLAYPHDVDAYKSSAAAKLGGPQALSDTKFVLVEQAKGKDGTMRNVLYLVDIDGATDISGKTAPDGKPWSPPRTWPPCRPWA
jgi:hypothetical protein